MIKIKIKINKKKIEDRQNLACWVRWAELKGYKLIIK